MRARSDHRAGTGHRGGSSARWRGAAVAAVVAAAVLSLAAGVVPASAAGRLHRDRHHPRELAARGGVAVDPSTHTAYVTNSQDDTVSVIDASTNAVTATITVGP